MASCWRALLASEDIEFKVLTFNTGKTNAAPFDSEVMNGIPHELLTFEQRNDPDHINQHVRAFKPDIIVLPGWFHKPYRQLASNPEFAHCKFVMCMDNPWLGTMKQHLGRLVDKKFRKRMDAVMVPGERAFQFAKRLGFEESIIHRGVYGIESAAFKDLPDRRDAQPGGWPKRFLFAGRYAPVKGLDTLISGYKAYRDEVEDPWPLTCCGDGELVDQLADVPGIDNKGFTQPKDMPERFAEAGCFVLSSRYDPWPLVVVESCMAGLPVVCSAACGSGVELVRPMYNGLIFGTGKTDSLKQCLLWMHHHHDELSRMGRRSTLLGEAYSPAMWVARWQEMFTNL